MNDIENNTWALVYMEFLLISYEWDVELNTREEISDLQAIVYFFQGWKSLYDNVAYIINSFYNPIASGACIENSFFIRRSFKLVSLPHSLSSGIQDCSCTIYPS